MYLHVDGARLANAAASLDASLGRADDRRRRRHRLLRRHEERPPLRRGGRRLQSRARRRLRLHPQAARSARLEDALRLGPVRGAARRTTCGCAAPRTPTRWRRGWQVRWRDRRRRDHPPGRGERRLRPAASRGDRQAAGRSARRAPVLCLGRGARRGALDVRVGYERGGRGCVRSGGRGCCLTGGCVRRRDRQSRRRFRRISDFRYLAERQRRGRVGWSADGRSSTNGGDANEDALEVHCGAEYGSRGCRCGGGSQPRAADQRPQAVSSSSRPKVAPGRPASTRSLPARAPKET